MSVVPLYQIPPLRCRWTALAAGRGEAKETETETKTDTGIATDSPVRFHFADLSFGGDGEGASVPLWETA